MWTVYSLFFTYFALLSRQHIQAPSSALSSQVLLAVVLIGDVHNRGVIAQMTQENIIIKLEAFQEWGWYWATVSTFLLQRAVLLWQRRVLVWLYINWVWCAYKDIKAFTFVTISVCCSHCVFCGHNKHKDITILFCFWVLLFYHTVRVRLPKLNQTDGLFQIVSRRATFNLNKRTKIAGRLLCPLYLIYSGSPVGPFWVNFPCQGPKQGIEISLQDSVTVLDHNYTFYSNFTPLQRLIAARIWIIQSRHETPFSSFQKKLI